MPLAPAPSWGSDRLLSGSSTCLLAGLFIAALGFFDTPPCGNGSSLQAAALASGGAGFFAAPEEDDDDAAAAGTIGCTAPEEDDAEATAACKGSLPGGNTNAM